MGKNKIGVEQNPHNGTWDVGWKEDDGDFTPEFCGYATKEEAEAQIPGFDARLENEMQEYQAERDAVERQQNQLWPNIAFVRDRIKRMKNLRAAIDAQGKLDALLDMEKHEHIGWPLPSWKAIKSGRV
jgi:hypothetical protein